MPTRPELTATRKLPLKTRPAFFAGLLFIAAAALMAAAPAQANKLPDFTKLVQSTAPAVVNISTTQKPGERGAGGISPQDIPEEFRRRFENTPFEDFFKRFLEQPPGQQQEGPSEEASLGSGFIISKDGYVLTNEHVIRGADKILVKLHDRRELPAKLIGADKRSDVAVLQIEAEDLPYVKIGETKSLQVGEWVVAIGSPFGFDHTVTAGIVSAKRRSLHTEQYVPFIQTDVAINPGNSGGPLFDMDGQVVGINSQIYSRTGGYMGMSFAIPIDLAMSVVRQLRENGHVSRGWLGVMIQEIDRDLSRAFGLDRPQGALVAQVLPDSPAAKAGLKVEDIILKFNGHPVVDSSALPPLVGITPPGDSVPVLVWRDGAETTLSVIIEELNDDGKTENASSDEKPLGLALAEIPKGVRKDLELGEGGVLIKEVHKGAGRDSGLRPGDLLLRLNGEDIKDPAHFKTLTEALTAGKVARLLVHRNGAQQFIPLLIPSADDKAASEKSKSE